MQKQFPKILLPPFLIWVICPSSVFLRKVCPILYLLFLQTITGIPKPEALEGFDASEFAIQFSEKLYDYPYWLQDLSHMPFFFIFTWLAHWFFVTEEYGEFLSDDIKNLIYTVNKEVNFDDMENDEQSVGSNGPADTKQTNLNDFEGSGEF